MSWDNPAQAGIFLIPIGLTGHGAPGEKRDNVGSGSAAAHIIFFFPAVLGPVEPARNAGCPFQAGVTTFCPNFCPHLIDKA